MYTCTYTYVYIKFNYILSPIWLNNWKEEVPPGSWQRSGSNPPPCPRPPPETASCMAQTGPPLQSMIRCL